MDSVCSPFKLKLWFLISNGSMAELAFGSALDLFYFLLIYAYPALSCSALSYHSSSVLFSCLPVILYLSVCLSVLFVSMRIYPLNGMRIAV